MRSVVFYGFQFPHHGRFSAFSALSREFEQEDVQVYRVRFPSTPMWWPSRMRRIACEKWFRVNEYGVKAAFAAGGVVHYFFPENSLHRAAAWKRSGRLVMSIHQPVEELRTSAYMQRHKGFFEGLRAADLVVLMASCELDAYRQLAPNSEVICIPHGVNTEFFSPGECLRTGRDADRFRILTVGNWLRDYGLWAQVVRQIAPVWPDVEFTVIANPDQIESIRRGVSGTAVPIRLLTDIEDAELRGEYRRADVLFLPLRNAWANNALLEGMSCGCPVVVTDLPATREYAGEAAWFVERGSADAAVEQLRRVRVDTAGRERLRCKARDRMVSQYSWKRIVQHYMNIYRTL